MINRKERKKIVTPNKAMCTFACLQRSELLHIMVNNKTLKCIDGEK